MSKLIVFQLNFPAFGVSSSQGDVLLNFVIAETTQHPSGFLFTPFISLCSGESKEFAFLKFYFIS